MKTHKQGVTLVEILVVVATIFLFVAIMSPAFKKPLPGYPAGTTVVRIDGCQYLEGGTYNNFTRTHKGNCDNPIHYQNHSNVNPER